MEYGKDFGDGVRCVISRLYPCNDQIGADGHPQVCLHRVFGIAPQRLDDEVLLDPFEEDLDLPSVAVEVRHLQRTDVEVVGNEAKRLAAVGVAVLH